MYTTPFCFYEALIVIKRKYIDKEITQNVYIEAASNMTEWFAYIYDSIKDLDFLSPHVFDQMEILVKKHNVKKHNLDFSDAFQILSVKEGFFSVLAGDSKTVLVTADKGLADAARKEGIKVWCVGVPGVPGTPYLIKAYEKVLGGGKAPRRPGDKAK